MGMLLNSPLYNAIVNYVVSGGSRLHMPGHKGQNIYDINDMSGLFKFDLTEIEGLGNLLDSQGVIKETEDFYRNIYGSKMSVMLTQGSTLGVQIMITSALMASEKKKMIIDRNAHISAVNTMALLDIEPVWVFHDICMDDFLPGTISADNIENQIRSNPDVDVVYITSPNYFGEVMDVASIFEVCRRYDKFLLVDNAHGAHLKFVFGGRFHPIDCGCSCCCDSLHKTLPVLTGGAMMHVLDDRLTGYVEKARKIYSSTSPSYLTMLSVDLLLNYIVHGLKDDFSKLLIAMEGLRKFINNLGFEVFDGENVDNFKLLIGPGKFNCNSEEITTVLKNFGIEPEYTCDHWVLLMFSPQNQEKDFSRIKEAVEYMSLVFNKTNDKKLKTHKNNENTFKCVKVEMETTLKQAMFGKFKKMKTIDSVGKISAGVVTTYPPGVPIIMPGEVVSETIAENLIKNKINCLDILVK